MKKYVFFDLDGTLTDPGIGITNCVMYALEKFGIMETDRGKLYKFIGPPLLDSFRDYYGFDEEKSRLAMKYYRERYGVTGLFENRVYDGMPELLAFLKNQGRTLVVATSKPTLYSEQILEKFGLSDYFTYVSGASMNENNSNKAIIISQAIGYLGISPDEVIMVGDRMHDIDGAKANNIPVVGVLYGYGNRREFEEHGADYIVKNVLELKELFSGEVI